MALLEYYLSMKKLSRGQTCNTQSALHHCMSDS